MEDHLRLQRIKQPCVDFSGNRLRDAVNSVRFVSAQTHLYDAWIIFHEFSHGLAAQAPYQGKLADAVVLFEWGRVEHKSSVRSLRKYSPTEPEAEDESDDKRSEAKNGESTVEVLDKGVAERSDVIGSIVQVGLHCIQSSPESRNRVPFRIGEGGNSCT